MIAFDWQMPVASRHSTTCEESGCDSSCGTASSRRNRLAAAWNRLSSRIHAMQQSTTHRHSYAHTHTIMHSHTTLIPFAMSAQSLTFPIHLHHDSHEQLQSVWWTTMPGSSKRKTLVMRSECSVAFVMEEVGAPFLRAHDVTKQ